MKQVENGREFERSRERRDVRKGIAARGLIPLIFLNPVRYHHGMEPAVTQPFSCPVPESLRTGAVVATLLLLLFLLPAVCRADIYQWKDAQGTIHFTDDISTIPAQYRKKASPLIHEGPSVISPEKSSPDQAGGQGAAPGPFGSDMSAEEAATREEAHKAALASQVEQQKAKIAAKEEHIRAVDQKRSLAVNPLRNRNVDPADMELYDKYKEELPADKERLRELESNLESSK